MDLVELFVPAGALGPDARRAAAERLLTALTTFDGATPESTAAIRRLWHVAVHDQAAVGGPDAGYLVRLTVPALSVDGGQAYLITLVTRALAEVVGGAAEIAVQVVEIPEGGVGYRGAVVREADIVRMVMGDAPGVPAVPVAPGADTAVDPVCGMTVPLSQPVPTLERDGDTYAFCCVGCRDVFAERLAS